MQSLFRAPLWIAAHWAELLEAIGSLLVVATIVTGLLPESARTARWLGWLVRAQERVSAAKHRDTPGTWKLPGTTAVQPLPAPPPLPRRESGEVPPNSSQR